MHMLRSHSRAEYVSNPKAARQHGRSSNSPKNEAALLEVSVIAGK